MAFSFFSRKSKQPEEGVAKRPASPAPGAARPVSGADEARPAGGDTPTARGDITAMGAAPFASGGGIEVTEGSADIGAAVEEAAIFFANDRADQATGVLLHHLREHPDDKDIQPWMMLFDLYQMQGMRDAFEERALEFVVKFERSPPIWTAPDAPKKKVSEALKPAGGNYFALTGVLSADSEPQFHQLRQIAEKAGNLRLDLSKIGGVEAAGSRLLQETLTALKRGNVKVQYIGVVNLTGLLRQALQGGNGVPDAAWHWLLLLDLYQILGKQEEFEELAVDYAVNFEVSPPSWEQPAEAVVVEEAPSSSMPESTPAEAPERPLNAYRLEGVITGNSEQALQGLVGYAEKHQDVRVDMGQVSRVDFVCVGNFLNALIRISTAGKAIQLLDVNEMVAALFEVMGVNQFATIVRRRRR